jgi:hypothetical protein
VDAELIFAAGRVGGVAYFSTGRLSLGRPIYLLDCELGPLSSLLLHGIFKRLSDLAEACSAPHSAVFTSSRLAEELERMGRRAEVIDAVLNDTALELSASKHIAAQRVRVCEAVLAKNFPLTFLQGAAVADDSDMVVWPSSPEWPRRWIPAARSPSRLRYGNRQALARAVVSRVDAEKMPFLGGGPRNRSEV